MSGPTAVVLRALGLGDLVTGVPALAALRRACPQHRIVLAAPRTWEPLVQRSGTVDEVVDSLELAPLDGCPRRPDLAVDLHGNGPASRDLLAELQPRRLIAYSGGPTRWRADEHETVRWCRLLADAFPQLDPRPVPVAGELGEPPRAGMPAGRTLVHCGAKAASRRWPAERFAAVALLLAAKGHDVLVTAGPQERGAAERIGAAAGVPTCVGPSTEQLLDLVGHARLVVSGDTGVAHLAAAYEVPTVTLFGPMSPAVWGPPPHPRHQVLFHGDGHGDPHGDVLDPALERITVAEVIEAAGRAQRSVVAA